MEPGCRDNAKCDCQPSHYTVEISGVPTRELTPAEFAALWDVWLTLPPGAV